MYFSLYFVKPEDSPVILLRAWAFLEGITPKEVFDHIYDTTARAKWDNVLADLTVVEKIDYETEVIHFVIKVFNGFYIMLNTYIDSFWYHRKRFCAKKTIPT